MTFTPEVSWGQAEIDPDHYEYTVNGSVSPAQPPAKPNRNFSKFSTRSAGIDPQQPSANTVILWNNAAIQAARDNNSGSLVMLRALGMMHTAMFDACALYDGAAQSTRGAVLRRPESDCASADKRKAISYAAHRVLVDLFPSSTVELDHLMTTLGLDPNLRSQDSATPAGAGLRAAAEVLEYHRPERP